MSKFGYPLIQKIVILVLAFALTIMTGCTLRPRSISSIPTVDPNATDETKALFINLWTLADSNQTLFGHQDDTIRGVGWHNLPGRSDVLEVSGSYPAVYGFDVADLELGSPTNLDGYPFDTLRERIIEAYRRGGVITISWHMNNPVTYENIGSDPDSPYPGRSWDTTPAVLTILPGGGNHAQYLTWLDRFAAFTQSLTVSGVPWKEEEHLVPIIFRPFHEHNGSVFWWGGTNTTQVNYFALWRLTVEYLRDEAGVHNLLYAFSPDARFMTRDFRDGRFSDLDSFQAEYFYAYPGDEYVDVIGMDNYADPELYHLGAYMNLLDYLVETSHGRSDLKIPALTETGGQRWDNPASSTWWTNFLYPAVVGTRSSGGQVAWVLTWTNWDEMTYAAPFPESHSADDFVEFKDQPMIHFEDEIPFNLYTWP